MTPDLDEQISSIVRACGLEADNLSRAGRLVSAGVLRTAQQTIRELATRLKEALADDALDVDKAASSDGAPPAEPAPEGQG